MRKILSVFTIAIIVFSCKKGVNVPLSFDYGSIENGVYDNTYFKLKIPIKSDWYVLNNEEADRLYEMGNDFAAGDNKSLKRTLDASQINLAKLVSVFKMEPGTNPTFNPNLLINAENITPHPSINVPIQYMAEAKKMISQTAMSVVYLDEKDSVKIGSQNFGFMQIANNMLGDTIIQDYYVTIKNGFAISMILSYSSDEDKKLLYEMFDGLKI